MVVVVVLESIPMLLVEMSKTMTSESERRRMNDEGRMDWLAAKSIEQMIDSSLKKHIGEKRWKRRQSD